MSAYGTGTSMAALLRAMRDGALQDKTHLKYLRAARVSYPPLLAITNEPIIFIVPLGSPEDKLGTQAAARVYRAVHKVGIYCCVYTASAEREDVLLGNNQEVGVLQFAEDVIAFYTGNALSLTGLEPGILPTATAGEDAYGIEQTQDEDKWLAFATLEYRATTKPFTR